MGQIPTSLQQVLDRLTDGLKALYGERFQGLVLFGSYARGDAREGSDVDLLLVLDGPVDPIQELARVEGIKWPLALAQDLVLSVFPVSLEEFQKADRALIQNARREGRAVA